MRILQRKKADEHESGFLDAQVADYVDENDKVWVSVDDLIEVMRELQNLVKSPAAMIELQNIEAALKGLRIKAKRKE